jgi:ABC-type uncharacterized transport system substrate-binding protein
MHRTLLNLFLNSCSCTRKSKIENPKWLGLSVMPFVLAVVVAQAQAQQPAQMPRIGFQIDSPVSAVAARIEGFRQGLRELGCVEGKNIIIEWRSAEGKPERRSEIAAELARLKVDAIVSAGPSVTRAVKEATSTIPIVMGQDTDPVGNGFIASLARPGGNITGVAALAPEMAGKQLKLLREIVPKLSHVAIIGNSTIPGDAQALRETVLAAGSYEIYLATWTSSIQRILRPSSEPQLRDVLMQSLCSGTPSSMPTESKSWTLR